MLYNLANPGNHWRILRKIVQGGQRFWKSYFGPPPNVLTDQDGRIRTSVFEQNVRAFLGDDNPVNARIRVGLETSGKHDRFAINNNGITIVAPDVRVQSDRVSVTDFQIVNGCQTSHVLYRSRDKVSDEVWLPLK